MGKLRPSRKCASTNRGQKAAREVLRMMRVALLSKAHAGGYGRSRSSTARNRRLCGMQHRSYANQDAVRLASHARFRPLSAMLSSGQRCKNVAVPRHSGLLIPAVANRDA